MIIRGIQARFACENGKQYETIGEFWDAMRVLCPNTELSGVGFGWKKDSLCYLIGTEAGLPHGVSGRERPDACGRRA